MNVYALCQTQVTFSKPMSTAPNNNIGLLIQVLHHGAVHKVRHAIFGQFLLPPCHTLSHIPGPHPKVRHTSRTPSIF